MVIYVSHKFGGDAENIEKAKKITHDLQIAHPEDCYVCPLLNFSYLEYKEMGYAEELELCIDLLSVCDKLLVASEISTGVQAEIDFANLVHMEVEYCEGLIED